MTSGRLVLVAALALSASVARSGERNTDPSAAVPAEKEWIDVTPAPAPRGLPLLGVAGGGRRAVDRAALRSLLVNREYARLTAVFEAFAARERVPLDEDLLPDAVDALSQPHARERQALDAWGAASPRSFAPLLVRASHWNRTAFLWRGSGWARDTSEQQFRWMREALSNARRDALRAQRLRPGTVAISTLLVSIENGAGRREQALRAFGEAAARCPRCYRPRAEWIWWLQPNWGGSIQEMESFAAKVADRRAPRLRHLRGWVEVARAQASEHEGQTEEALAHLDRACDGADEAKFFLERADLRGPLQGERAYLEDLDRAYALDPGSTDVVSRKAWALANGQRWEEAGEKLLYVLRANPTSRLGANLHPGIVRALVLAARREDEEGRCASAERVVALASKLAPSDPEVASVAVAVRCAQGERRAGGPSVSGDIRPWLRVSVADASGAPVGGAPILVGHGDLGWEPLARMIGGGEEVVRTSENGEAKLPASDVGVRTVVAIARADPLRAVAARVEVTTSGARARLVVGGPARIAGKVVDDAFRPVPDVVVTALPDEGIGPNPRALGSARSAADGVFAIEGLDSGGYRLLARGPAYTGVAERVGGGQDGVVVRVHRLALMRGRVLVERGVGPPRPPAAFTVRGPFGERAFTSADGTFTVEVNQNPIPVGRVAFKVEGYPETIRRLDLSKSEIDAGDVVVGPGRAIRGVVLDPKGYPCPGAVVRRDWGEDSVKTSASGAFEITVANEPLDLEVRGEGYLPARTAVAADVGEVVVHLSAGLAVRILAVDEEGAPVSGIHFVASAGEKWAVCTTEPTGRCEVAGLVPGMYTVRALPDPRQPGGPVWPESIVPVEAGREGALLVRWPRARNRLSVKVIDEKGEASTSGALVFEGSVSQAQAFSSKWEVKLPHRVVPETGLEGLPSGRYTVFGRGDWGFPCARVTVDVKAGDDRALAMRLGDGTCP